MSAKPSQRQTDEVIWEVVAVKPGEVGLDTRLDAPVGSCKTLKNAQFVETASISRRPGYVGQALQDGSDYPQSISGAPLATDSHWVYGHGLALESTDVVENSHVPFAGRGKGVFCLDNQIVVWTGDRLLVHRQDNVALGASSHWTPNQTAPWGVPAYLPLLTGASAPEPVSVEYSATCVTLDLRVVATISLSQFVLWTIDRSTDVVIDKTVLEGTPFSVTGKRVQAIEAEGVPYVIYVDTDGLQIGRWTGSQWQFSEEPGVTAFATAKTVSGFHVLMIQSGQLRLVEYAGAVRTSANYLPMTTVTGLAVAPVRHPALAVDPAGLLHVVYVGGVSSDDVRLLVLNQDGTVRYDRQVNTGAANPVITVTTRTLKGTESVHNSVVYIDIVNTVTIKEVNAATNTTVANGIKYWSRLVSHAFTVGNAPMVWLLGLSTSPWFLVSGVNAPQVIAFANREEGAAQTEESNERGLSVMAPDPAGELRYTVSTHRKSTVVDRLRLFDVDFLPRLSSVQYGASVYLSGSAPRNWDGMSLGDAGFQDYPIISSLSAGAGGSLSAGQYRFRAYAVRTNAKGEKFSSPAVTTAAVTVTAGQKISVTVGSIPTVNSATKIEVYRTEADGTVFYLDATFNNPTTLNVTYDSDRSDLGLLSQPIDPRAPGVGVDAETQEFGPIGCEIFTVIGDRLWGAGGQVPSGSVQYSKLKEAGEGAGFDSLASTQVVDLAGNKITSLVPIASGICVLQADQIYILNGDGPNNIGVGTFGITELRLAGGATTHAGTYNTQIGAVYWGASGPRLLDQSLRVVELWPPVEAIVNGREPIGVYANLDRQEVTWLFDTGAVHLSFDRERLRWSEWTTPNVAALCQVSGVAVTPDGRVLTPTAGVGDDGAPFALEVETGEIVGDDTLGERTLLQEVGVVGKYEGMHELLLRVSYDRGQTWTDSWTWQPTTNTWLTSGDNYASLTPAQIDALSIVDRSGTYATHKRVSVPQCRSFRFYVSDVSSHNPTTTLHELNFSIGSRPGYGRVSTNKFGG